MEPSPRLSALLPPPALRHLARRWLEEDCPHFDLGGPLARADRPREAALLQKSPGLLAGAPFVDAVFAELGCAVEWHTREGGAAPASPCCPRRVATVRGEARLLLLGERAALNCLARASGVASACWGAARAAEGAGWGGRLAGTRKTTPGFRLVEKYAMAMGGVATHRYDLGGMLMVKDNHIAVAGGMRQAVTDARKVAGLFTKIEVEARCVEEALEAAALGVDIVMLDNFSPQDALEAAQTLKAQFPHLLIEVSGGISKDTLAQYFSPHVDIISLGYLTQHYAAVDFSLKIVSETELGNGEAQGATPGSDPAASRRDFAF